MTFTILKDNNFHEYQAMKIFFGPEFQFSIIFFLDPLFSFWNESNEVKVYSNLSLFMDHGLFRKEAKIEYCQPESGC